MGTNYVIGGKRMKKYKHSEILWLAGNEHLSETGEEIACRGFTSSQDTWRYSCDAILETLECSNFQYEDIQEILSEMGLDAGMVDMYNAFKEFKEGEERQGARYLWLDFVRVVLEDEGK